MQRFICLGSLTVLLVMSSCLPASVGIAVTNTVEPSPTYATATLTPTEVLSTFTPSPEPLPPIRTQCVTNSQKLDLNGVVAFEKAGKPDSFEFGLFLLNLKNRNTIREVDEGFLAQVSPNRKHVAFEYSKDGRGFLSVMNSNGKTVNDFPFLVDGKIQSFFNWQNAEQLRTIQLDISQGSKVYIPKNPFSNEKKVQWKFDERITEISFVDGANVLYDPSLTRVFYPKDDGVVVLVNVETEAELANARFVDWGQNPSWSPDGEYLMILNHEGSTDEFYLVSRDGGEFQKMTDFSREFDFVSIPEYTWSPDGKQIVFWLNAEVGEREDGAQSELAVLNVENGQVTRLCIHGISNNAYEPWTMNHPEPIWSPNGKYIMITQWDDPERPQKYNVLVVDPLTGGVDRISENTAPIGWMVNEP